MLLLVSLPLLLLVERIWRFGVDAPFIDQWSMVEDLDKHSRGAWTIDDLLRSHNGHRLLLLRLVLVPLAFLTGWNVRVEMFLGVALAASTFALFAGTLRRAHGGSLVGARPWGLGARALGEAFLPLALARRRGRRL